MKVERCGCLISLPLLQGRHECGDGEVGRKGPRVRERALGQLPSNLSLQK